jgi:predicted transcriptional regulator
MLNNIDNIPAILEAANGGANETKLMYDTYLSCRQLKEYLSLLVQRNLVTCDDMGKFKTTEKGLRLLRYMIA